MKSKHLKIALFSTLGTVLVASAGIGAFVVAVVALSRGNGRTVVEQIKIEKEIGNTGIYMYEYSDPYESTKDNHVFYLGEDGLNMLVELFEETVGYGPEIAALKGIHINNYQFNDSGSYGYYVPTSKDIVLNPQVISDILPVTYNTTDQKKADDLLEAKVEVLYQTLFHEYHHHVAQSYYTNHYNAGDSSITDLWEWHIDENGYGRGYSTTWNTYALEEFKSYLNYDVETPLYDEDTGPNPIPGNYNKYSLGSLGNSKYFFDIANSATTSEALDNYNLLATEVNQKDYLFAGQDDWIYDYEDSSMSAKNINYYFSMHELYTRKYMQVRYPNYSYNDNNMWFGSYIGESYRGTYGDMSNWGSGNGFGVTTYMFDARTYQDKAGTKWVNESEGIVDSESRYLHDAPFNQDKFIEDGDPLAYEKMVDFSLESFGASYGSELSYMVAKNSTALYSSSSVSVGPSSDTDYIKFGGFLTDNIYSEVGYENEDGTFTWLDIFVDDYTYNYKDALDETYQNVISDGAKKFWALEEYIHINDIKDKPLYGRIGEEGTPTLLKNAKDGSDNHWPANNTEFTHQHSLQMPIVKASTSENNEVIITDIEEVPSPALMSLYSEVSGVRKWSHKVR